MCFRALPLRVTAGHPTPPFKQDTSLRRLFGKAGTRLITLNIPLGLGLVRAIIRPKLVTLPLPVLLPFPILVTETVIPAEANLLRSPTLPLLRILLLPPTMGVANPTESPNVGGGGVMGLICPTLLRPTLGLVNPDRAAILATILPRPGAVNPISAGTANLTNVTINIVNTVRPRCPAEPVCTPHVLHVRPPFLKTSRYYLREAKLTPVTPSPPPRRHTTHWSHLAIVSFQN